MAEPTSSAAVGAAGGALTVVSTAGVITVMGMQADALLIGLCAAVLTIYWLRGSIDTHGKAFCASALAALFAAIGCKVAGPLLTAHVANLGEPDDVRRLLALLLGGAFPFLWPLAIDRAKDTAGSIGK